MASLIGLCQRLWAISYPLQPPKSPNAIKIGLLGASNVAVFSIIAPAKSHPGVVLAAIAGRDFDRTSAYAKKYDIPKVHKTYQDLLDDPSIDAIYNPLPNGRHFEFSLRALRAGKHVLLEKPSVSNATEAETLFNYHASLPDPKPVLLEAFHYRFHPAWTSFLYLITPSEISIADSSMPVPGGYLAQTDIRYSYDLSGGAIMDPGTYPISALRQVFGTEPEECLSSKSESLPAGRDQKIDKATKATWRFPNVGVGTISADMDLRWRFGIPGLEPPIITVKHREVMIDDEAGNVVGQTHSLVRTVKFWNFVMPHFWHRIDIVDEHIIRDADGNPVKTWTEKKIKKAYTWDQQEEGTTRVGEDSWTTFRHQLEEFVNKIKERQGSGIWIEGEDSIRQMRMIDEAYVKAGLPVRPTSKYK